MYVITHETENIDLQPFFFNKKFETVYYYIFIFIRF
jgi:hypothetical protein